MIALKDDLPLIQLDSGQVVAFQRDWLLRSLIQAAHKAGYHKWWLAEHVAESVTTYLLLRFQENVLAVPRLAKAVQSVLQVIGYAEVAHHFTPGPPLVKISLAEFAREAGHGYELAFFDILGRKIQELINANSTYFELFGLELCVKQLRSKKVWSRDCNFLRAEIVSFVREQIAATRLNQEIVFSLV